MFLKLRKREGTYYAEGTMMGRRIRRNLNTNILKIAAERMREIETSKSSVGFDQFVDTYRRSRTLHESSEQMLDWMIGYWGKTPLRLIDSEAISRWEMGWGAVSPETRRRYKGQFKAVMNEAERMGLIEKAPYMKLPSPGAGRKRVLNDDEIRALMGAASDSLRLVILFMLYTGSRIKEARSVQWSDITGDSVVLETRKGGAQRRSVPIHPDLAKALEGSGKIGNVLRDERGAVWTHERLHRAFKEAAEKAGVSGVRLYDMRRTFATRLLEEGGDLRSIAELLGHKGLNMLERSYAHVSRRHLEKQIMKLPWRIDHGEESREQVSSDAAPVQGAGVEEQEEGEE